MNTNVHLKRIKHHFPLFFGLIIFQCLVSCEQEPGPENTLRKWLTYMSAGECDNAIDLEIEYSMASVIVENCDPYESEIKSIICETGEETAACSCIEMREFGQEKQTDYDLKKVDGGWKMVAIH